MNLKSCIYEGHVRHRRFRPVENSFRYRIFFMFLDLEELPGLFHRNIFWSHDRVNLAYLRRRDHLGDPRVPLQQAVRDLVEDRLGKRVVGQQKGIVAVSNAVRRARSGLQDPNRPIGSFIFMGPTGVGKTELAKALAEFMFGTEDALLQLDVAHG